MTLEVVLLAILSGAVAAVVLVPDWRVSIGALVVADLCRIGIIQQSTTTFAGRSTALIVEGVTALSIGLILLITALTLRRDFDAEQLDEFALFELRRAARRAQQQRTQFAGRWSGYVVPTGAVLLAGLATWLISQTYPVVSDPVTDIAWLFMLLCGLLVLITANDVLKLGLGLMLLAASVKLLYFGVATRINVLQLGLIEAVTLLLALITAYLSGLLFARLHTLDFDSLLERR